MNLGFRSGNFCGNYGSAYNKTFGYCSGLTSVDIPNSVTWIGIQAFCGCSGLTEIVVESGNSVFDSRNGCNAIIETATNTLIAGCKTTVIPNSVTSIGDDAFRGCSGLTSIVIPNSVTSIGEYAFGNCGLTSIVVPNSVTSIGKCAFYKCSNIDSIFCKSYFPPSTNPYAFYGIPTDIPVYVCPCTEELYQAAEGWNRFTNIQAVAYYQLTVVPNFIEMGTAAIIQQPDCETDAIVQATPNDGVPFSGCMENGEIVSTDNPFQFTLTGDRHLVACFGHYGVDDNALSCVEVYPNPARDVLAVEGENLVEIEICNMMGQRVATHQAEGSESRIDISGLQAGMYCVGITDANGKRCVRMIVKE